ncbi:hypothetical protein SAMN02745664_11042 [Moraxella cuniculi DSM 21768]|uniref:Uncharacterized protein n=2 Tax=Moraxella cuniculi TaxID=34061 RepID=A0A1N7F6I6_9GAMM|nr:hypothetical protein [Moraxella cuniculi]OOS06434.1 hypothetical protein B0189_04975 [Moraxella cuniculi]SIR95987.1 hypothetical protein SAMN02745664_11042 [Moraxella cuniculi DSM 21768]VEG12162.1 Uncharacterised protein [Moraxella cuniculi]
MCCKIELNNRQDAAHFLGKTTPKPLAQTAENLAPADIVYTGEAVSLFDKLLMRLHRTPKNTP